MRKKGRPGKAGGAPKGMLGLEAGGPPTPKWTALWLPQNNFRKLRGECHTWFGGSQRENREKGVSVSISGGFATGRGIRSQWSRVSGGAGCHVPISGIFFGASCLVLVSIWVYTREISGDSCPIISRATASLTPAFFRRLVAVWRRLWKERPAPERFWSPPAESEFA